MEVKQIWYHLEETLQRLMLGLVVLPFFTTLSSEIQALPLFAQIHMIF